MAFASTFNYNLATNTCVPSCVACVFCFFDCSELSAIVHKFYDFFFISKRLFNIKDKRSKTYCYYSCRQKYDERQMLLHLFFKILFVTVTYSKNNSFRYLLAKFYHLR